MISSATLDLEPRRLSLLISGLYALDTDPNLSGALLERESLRLDVVPKKIETAFRHTHVRASALTEREQSDVQCLVIMT
jgi:hypothetical protein